ncbi:MAG: hypothetical protein A2168_08775 [Planctomycetes bacterium RBG_13_50_24]|nr:MAG: hypothetical protein A2168_08775 [Planctomycetes bacterium RBG_13_50_24]
MRKLAIILACFAIAGFSPSVFAYIQWSGSPVDTDWNNPENWDGGVLPTNDKAGVKSEPVGPIIVEGDVAVCMQLTLGGVSGGTIRVAGGVFNVTNNSAIIGNAAGENGTLILNSGQFIAGGNFYAGLAGDATVYFDGGTVSVGSVFGIGERSTSTAAVYLGVSKVTCETFRMDDRGGATVLMDIANGTLIVDGDETAKIQTYIDNGWIIAFDGAGTLEMDYDVRNPEKTTLTAVHPLGISPANNQIVTVDVTALTWNLPEPNQAGAVVTCDVYLGTDTNGHSPNYDYQKVVTNESVESYAVTLEPGKIYYWKVDVFENGELIFDAQVPSTFSTGNVVPTVNAGGDITAWLIDGKAQLDLAGTVEDDGRPAPYTVKWTVTSQPEGSIVEFTPASVDAESLSVVCDSAGDYILELAANDLSDTGTDTITIHVFENACEATKSLPNYVPLVGDLNADCRVDDLDLALLQENWLKNIELTSYYTE